MPTPPPTRKAPRKMPAVDRRAPPDAKGAPVALRKMKGVLSRPLGFERRGSQLHVVLVERRRTPTSELPPSLEEQRTELRERLLSNENDQAAKVMRHLVFVHDELGRKGWHGVELLPAHVIGKAIMQAELLASQEPSKVLASITEKLRLLKVSADVREERKQQLRSQDNSENLEVSEATREEFDETERNWIDTPSVPPPKPPPPGSAK